KHIIQATDNFDLDQLLPIGVKIEQEGEATFRIEELSNIPEDKNIILHDKTLNIYHDLKQSNYTVILSPRTYSDRFEIVFDDQVLNNHGSKYETLTVNYANDLKSIVLHNPDLKMVYSIEIANILGQLVYTNEEIKTENYSEYHLKGLTTGAYIINVKTDKEHVVKKIIVE
ncbi:T9SS type A sorting domain-containing protein, partial [Flavobacteriaceae sp. LMIT009]